MNGHLWETTCKCAANKIDLQESNCNPSNLKIFRDRKGEGMTSAQVRKLVGNIRKYNWAKVSKSYFTCVDGRVTKQSLSTPGGDAGEFLLALHTYQNYFGSRMKLTLAAVDRMFQLYIHHMEAKVFNMCTDDQSLNHLQRQLSVR